MIEMMVTSSVIILAIFLVRSATRGRISMKLRYALWIAAALRLLLPVSVGNSPVSVMNLLPQSRQGTMAARTAEGEESDERAAGGGNDILPTGSDGQNWPETGALSENLFGQGQKEDAKEPAEETVVQSRTKDFLESGTKKERTHRILGSVWILGTVSVGGYMIISQARFSRILRRRRCAVGEDEIPRMFAHRLAERGMRVYWVEGLASPCLVGRNIYIDTELSTDRRKFLHVLAHEYCHARQHDTLWAFLRSALAAVYWFHPLVWAAAFAARQDSELACDEAVILLLGEGERFAYGRTLLYLLCCGAGGIDCAGTTLTMEGRKHGVKERVRTIAQSSGRKRWIAAAVVMTMLLVCGCAFTGSDRESDALQEAENGQASQERAEETTLGQTDRQQVLEEESNGEFDRVRDEYEDAVGVYEQEDAFLAALHYQGIMDGKDDSDLFLDRKADIQAYYDYQSNAKDGDEENPLENGWYLICRNEEAQISLYGLYTQEFGFRGVKTLIGEDVNTYDITWCLGRMNENGANIRVLEGAEDGFPRRFVFKILSENTSEKEIWNLYSGYRYDTGTVQIEELTAETYLDWVDQNLSFAVDEEGSKVLITYDGDMALESLDISAYQGQKVEGVRISPNVAGFELDCDAYDKDMYEGYEGVVLYLAVGLKLEGEEIWFDGLNPLTLQVLCPQNPESEFALKQPRVDPQSKLSSPMQSRKME